MIRQLLFVALCAPALVGAADLDARLAEGAALAARGERDAARAVFERLAAENPERPEPLNDLAALAAADGDLERARALLERALATHPSYRAVHDNLAAIYAAQAGAAYRKALPLEGTAVERPTLLVLVAAVEPRVQPADVPLPIAEPSVSYEWASALPPAEAPSAPVMAAASPSPATIAPRVPAPAAVVDPRRVQDARALSAFAAVDAWLAAWARKDVAGYLGAYAPGFVPPDGLSRAAWEAQRAARIRAPQRITITLEQRHLTLEPSGERARMTFVQHYRSDRFSSDSFKTLTLVRERGVWRIATERTGR
jgi:tetratricopeptide (TPR) repeat protein